jgi:hypothetical protein
VNRKGQPHGPSPHHPAGSTGYGVISWDEAMNLGGSTQVALGKKLFEQYEWFKFRPHREWAVFDAKAPLGFDGGQWIWFPEGNPAKDAPVGKRSSCRRGRSSRPRGCACRRMTSSPRS